MVAHMLEMQTELTDSNTGMPDHISVDCGRIVLVGSSSQPEYTPPPYPAVGLRIRLGLGIRSICRWKTNYWWD